MGNDIKILERSVALKIAAGEVIERPASVLRELLDNSIDAHSSEISVYLTSSGMEELRVIDNGSGMGKEDLEICFLPHATSKIEHIEDIYKIWTLGFRGEALSSITASARTEIISSPDDSGEGYKLSFENGKHEVKASRANKGTIVSVKDLFYMLPARKKFLKSPSSETTLCKNTFLEKAASNPEITFRLFIENKMVFFLPSSDFKLRACGCYPAVFKEIKMCHSLEYKEKSFSIQGILNSPELTRKDRKYIHIYINGRRIQEYSLVQAVIYGFSNFIPGGIFPSAVVFIEVDPELVDFNIHPAKKEARVKNIRIIHHALSASIAELLKNESTSGRLELNKNIFSDPVQRDFHHDLRFDQVISDQSRSSEITPLTHCGIPVRSRNISYDEFSETVFQKKDEYTSDFSTPGNLSGASEIRSSDYGTKSGRDYMEINAVRDFHEAGISDLPKEKDEYPADKDRINSYDFKYIGSLFNLFLICEKDDDMYLIDQHAADEKIIYQKLSSRKPDIQPLLIPLYPESGLTLTEKMIENYKKAGIIIKKDDTGDYFIDAMPAVFFEIKSEVLEIITKSPGNIDEIKKALFASISCKKAVKKGDRLTEKQAVDIISGAFNLEAPFCPHGRPIWKKITKQELLEEINRIV